MSKVKLVLFDIGNVVIRSTHQITIAIFWELGVRPDKAPLFFHQKAYGEFARGQISGEQFAEATREALEAPWLTDKQILVAHNAHLYMVDDEIVAIIDEISAKGHLLGFVTTTNEWQTEQELQLIDLSIRYHCPVVRSHRIRMSKTDAGAWPVILRELRDNLSESGNRLLIDDSKSNNDSAEASGLETHLYHPRPGVGVLKLRADLRDRGILS